MVKTTHWTKLTWSPRLEDHLRGGDHPLSNQAFNILLQKPLTNEKETIFLFLVFILYFWKTIFHEEA